MVVDHEAIRPASCAIFVWGLCFLWGGSLLTTRFVQLRRRHFPRAQAVLAGCWLLATLVTGTILLLSATVQAVGAVVQSDITIVKESKSSSCRIVLREQVAGLRQAFEQIYVVDSLGIGRPAASGIADDGRAVNAGDITVRWGYENGSVSYAQARADQPLVLHFRC